MTILGMQMLAAYLYYIKCNTKQNRQCPRPQHNPLGLAFWQGRRWNEATTLPQSAAKMQPLRVGLSKPSAYSRLNMLINQTTKAHSRNDKPLGLVFWQGRRWSEATTLPQSAAKGQPLRVGLSKPSAYRRVNTQINPNHQSPPRQHKP